MCDCQFQFERRSALLHLTRRAAFALGLFAVPPLLRNSFVPAVLRRLLGQETALAAESTPVPFIDTHIHFQARGPGSRRLGTDYPGAAHVAELAMNEAVIARSIVMPPPFPDTTPRAYDYEDFIEVVRGRRRSFAFLGGGGSLNPMIHAAARSGHVDAASERRFEARALEILAAGAVGFGELCCEHFSFFDGHPYAAAPPDHPLFLKLADIAAQRDVPIEIHMEAIKRDRPTPERLLDRSSANPPTLAANIDRFRNLLAANRKARIVWAHVGWDNTGERTVALCRDLLAENPNLYMNTKIHPTGGARNRLLDDAGMAVPEWIELVRQFPDRFLVGSDTFHTAPSVNMRREPGFPGVRRWVDQLPAEVVHRVAIENAQRVYKLATV
jgi:hypothetical protein